MAVPTSFSPVASREVWIAREAAAGVTPATLGMPWALTSFKPSDKPTWIMDESFQGAMGDEYGQYQGPLIGDWSAGGHVFADTIGHALYGTLGDYTTTGTANTTTPVSGTTNAIVAAGVTALPVASGGASFTAGMFISITDTGSPPASEVVKVGTGSTSTSVVLDPTTPTRFAHASGVALANTMAPYTHVWAVLNGPNIGWGPSQPPSYCVTHKDGIAANGGNQYAYSCFSELALTGNADKLLDFTVKATSQSRQTAASALASVNVSAEAATPSWRTAVGIGGPASSSTLVKYVAEHSVTITRQVKAMNTEQGAQTPYVIARGKQGVAGKITIGPSIDDAALIAMLANSQPQLQFLTSNGLTGTAVRSLQLDILLAAYKTADEQDGAELFGYDVGFTGIHTAASSGGITMTGASGLKGAVKATLVNAVPTY